MAEKKRRLQAIVSGRVQGVGFRYHVLDAVRGLALHGFVRNLSDGRVEVIAEGEETVLKQLEAILWQGPPHADVRDVTVTWSSAKGGLPRFTIASTSR